MGKTGSDGVETESVEEEEEDEEREWNQRKNLLGIFSEYCCCWTLHSFWGEEGVEGTQGKEDSDEKVVVSLRHKVRGSGLREVDELLERRGGGDRDAVLDMTVAEQVLF